MRRFFRPVTSLVITAALFASASGYAMQSAANPAPAGKMDSKSKPAATPAPSAQDIADAHSKGMVWVNTSTKVYHKADSSMFGKTKRGKFMTEDDARKAGYRAAHEPGANRKSAPATK
ncbi:MAG: hypothetical protein M3N93_06965 [Acidobacteriota bacterium]|nr:hypothetical protein [Acidobacteriota bacterium]